MHTRKALSSALLLIMLLAQVASAGSNLRDWNNVRILEVGTGVSVKTRQGEKHQGYVKRATADTLTIVIRDWRRIKEIDFRKDEIKEIRLKRSRAFSAAVGGIAGIATGIAIGAIVDEQGGPHAPVPAKFVFGLLGVTFGASLGAFGQLDGRRIYSAP